MPQIGLACTYPVRDCGNDEGVWHQKGSFGFLEEGDGESRNGDLKQNYPVNAVASGFTKSHFGVKAATKRNQNSQTAILGDAWG